MGQTLGVMPSSHNIDIRIEAGEWSKILPNWQNICKQAAKAVLESQWKINLPAEISIVLADDAFVRNLNKLYRGQDVPTNVLSFPSNENYSEAITPRPIGDVVFAFETCCEELFNGDHITEFADHICHLVVHGVLHLLGYKHEIKVEAEQMESLEIQILANLGVQNPYGG